MIKEKLEADANKLIQTFKEDETMQLLNGRYGAYLKIGRKNFRLPKGVDPAKLTYAECVEVSKNQVKAKPKAKAKAKAKPKTKKKK